MRKKTLSALSLAASMVIIAGCQSSDEGRFDPRALGNEQRLASRTFQAEPLRPLPTTLQSKFLPEQRDDPRVPPEAPAASPLAPESQIVRMPLREVTQRAVANNLNVKVSGYTPAIEETRITEAEARFDPEVFMNITAQRQRDANVFGSFAGSDFEQVRLETGIRQALPTGGSVELAYRPSYTWDPDNLDDADQFGNGGAGDTAQDIGIQITQPLLRDFGSDVNRARIVINRFNQRISLLDFRRDLEEMLRNVEQTYWQLVQAQRNVTIQEGFLQRAIDTANIVSIRFNQDVTIEQISTSVSRVESGRIDLIRARQRVQDLSDQLKNLMNDPQFPIAGNTLLLPSDTPLEVPVTFDLNDSVQTALLNRYELGQQQLRVDSASVALDVARNNRLPQLNLVGGIGLRGLGEDYAESFEDISDADFVNWSIGLQFTQRLGNREAKAIYRRAQLQRLQAMDQYRALIDQVTLDVSIAQREVQTSFTSIGQSRAARFAAQRALQAVQDLEVGGEQLSPDFLERKLARQQELAIAERAEAESIAFYNIALSRLESAKGTLLRYNNVLMEEKKR
ncbi:MAG TPA: TolC family protein [Tepidisphaeraceae bacterium]